MNKQDAECFHDFDEQYGALVCKYCDYRKAGCSEEQDNE